MAEQGAKPPNVNLNVNLPPPSISSQSSAPFTPRSTSIVDDSDAEFDPTPMHSPRGGPAYEDLPPSYDEAQQQAITDARSGVAPLDPNQLEAHRLTLNEAPGEPEIWEYRVRGEEPDVAAEHEQAPAYENFTNHLGTTVPVQHVQGSESIPVGRTGDTSTASNTSPTPAANLLTQALEFTRHEADSDVQYAPRLNRPVAIPQLGVSRIDGQQDQEHVQFLRAYAKALHAHSIRPAELTEFLDGLNALCLATGTTIHELSSGTPNIEDRSTLVHEYIRGANEAFFAPRGLRVSIQSLPALMEVTNIPTDRGQRAGAIASVLDEDSTPERRAQALHPHVEALDTNVPEPSARTLLLREMGGRMRNQLQDGREAGVAPGRVPPSSNQNGGKTEWEDPPHSIPEPSSQSQIPPVSPGSRHESRGGRRGHHGGPWTPFGAPGNGPFGPPGHGPFGAPGQGPFGRSGPRPPGSPFSGFPHRGRGRGRGSRHADRPRSANEWATLSQDLGKWGEELGKRMGEWGEQFGKQAGTWGQNVGQRAAAWGDDVSARASGSTSRTYHTAPPPPPPPADDLPPSYQASPAGQESGVLHGDNKSTPSRSKPDATTYSTEKKSLAPDDDDYDSDSSSISSLSSSDSSDSDSDSDDPDPQAFFQKRIHEINSQALASTQKGKQPASQIEHDRAQAIEAAHAKKLTLERKVQRREGKRKARREFKARKRELRSEAREKKRAFREKGRGESGKNREKGKGKAKGGREWKEAKREYREAKRALKKEKREMKKEWKKGKSEVGGKRGVDVVVNEGVDEMQGKEVGWVVIENLGE